MGEIIPAFISRSGFFPVHNSIWPHSEETTNNDDDDVSTKNASGMRFGGKGLWISYLNFQIVTYLSFFFDFLWNFTFLMHPWWHCSMRIDDGDSSEYNPLRAWHNPFVAISTRPIDK